MTIGWRMQLTAQQWWSRKLYEEKWIRKWKHDLNIFKCQNRLIPSLTRFGVFEGDACYYMLN